MRRLGASVLRGGGPTGAPQAYWRGGGADSLTGHFKSKIKEQKSKRDVNYALGVDIGGTKVSVTLGDERGKILAKEVLPTRTGKSAPRGIEEIALALGPLKRLSKKSGRLRGIGVGIPGPMDPRRGLVERSPHLHGWQGFPLKSFLEKRLRLPVFITNDANAAAMGEKVFGGGRGVENFVYLTVSTGIGSGIVLGGRLLIGASFGAGEVGHSVVVADGARCGCGNQGCLEAYASGTAIAGFVRSEIRRGRRSRISELIRSQRKVTAEAVALAARRGDRLAGEAYRRAGYFLGIGLANLINILNPELLILGGSVMKSSGLLWTPMKAAVRRNAWPGLRRACRIVKTRLGDRVGDLGALSLVFCNEGRFWRGHPSF